MNINPEMNINPASLVKVYPQHQKFNGEIVPTEINWSCIGSVSVKEAKEFANYLLKVCKEIESVGFENAFDAGLLDDEYFAFIREKTDPEKWRVGNGDDILSLFESQYMFNKFREHYLEKMS